jgi:hypothetical protein
VVMLGQMPYAAAPMNLRPRPSLRRRSAYDSFRRSA